MHQPIARAQTPQWRRAYLIRSGRQIRCWRDRDAVTGADVVQQKVAVRVDDLVSESGRNDELATVDWRIRRRGYQCRCVTDVAAAVVEYLLAGANRDGDRTSRWRLGGANEVCKGDDIEAVILRIVDMVVGGYRAAAGRVLRR